MNDDRERLLLEVTTALMDLLDCVTDTEGLTTEFDKRRAIERARVATQRARGCCLLITPPTK